jgi:hypothetical protein
MRRTSVRVKFLYGAVDPARQARTRSEPSDAAMILENVLDLVGVS